VSKYETLLFLHLVSVGLLIAGAGISTATGIAMGKTGNTTIVGALARLGSSVEYFVTVPGAVGAIVFGTWLVDEAGYDFGETWISAAYVIWIIAIGIGTGVLGRHAKQVARMAAELRLNGVDESEELRAEAGKPIISILGMLEVVFIVLFLWLMTAKPGA
jgi:uncharacterized membrane protein